MMGHISSTSTYAGEGQGYNTTSFVQTGARPSQPSLFRPRAHLIRHVEPEDKGGRHDRPSGEMGTRLCEAQREVANLQMGECQ